MWNQGSRDQQRKVNWASWCRDAGLCLFYCRGCKWPLDYKGPGLPLLDLCAVCLEMNRVIIKNPYFARLDKEDFAKRRDMGLGTG